MAEKKLCQMFSVYVGDGSGGETKCVAEARWHTSDGLDICTEHAKGLIEEEASYVLTLLETDKRCPDCSGRGWHVGECRPQETCGTCNGTGQYLKHRDQFDALKKALTP